MAANGSSSPGSPAGSPAGPPRGNFNLEAAAFKHSNGVRLPFFTAGNFSDAQRFAQSEAKFLFLYLHSDLHPNTEYFLKNCLTCDAFVLLLREHFVLYGASVSEVEGYKLSEHYRATTYPFVSILIKKDTVMQMQGDFTRQDFLAAVKKSMEIGEPIRAQEVTWVADRKGREMMRTRQERELAEAERIDAERLAKAKAERESAAQEEARQKAEEENRKREAREKLEAEERAQQQALEEARKKENQKQMVRQLALQNLIPEDDERIANASDPANDTTTIRLVSLDGTPHERRFSVNTPTSQLYFYAQVQPEYDGRPFTCYCGFPPQAVPNSDTQMIKEFKNLSKRAVVNMREDF